MHTMLVFALCATLAKADVTWRNLSVHFKDVQALAPCSGDVEAGQAVALMGPTGCGKTSLVDALSGRPFVVDSASTGGAKTEMLRLERRERGAAGTDAGQHVVTLNARVNVQDGGSFCAHHACLAWCAGREGEQRGSEAAERSRQGLHRRACRREPGGALERECVCGCSARARGFLQTVNQVIVLLPKTQIEENQNH